MSVEVACNKCGKKGSTVVGHCSVTIMKNGKPDSTPTTFELCPICCGFLAIWIASQPEST